MAHTKPINGSKPFVQNKASRMKPGRRRSIQQVLDMQEAIYQNSMAGNVRPADLASLARAFDVLEDRKRILRGKPLPGSLKPKPKKHIKNTMSVMPIDMEITQDKVDSQETRQEVHCTQAGMDGIEVKESLSGQ